MTSEIIQKELEDLKKTINRCSTMLKKLPAGSITVSGNGSWTKWFVRYDGSPHYLPKKQRATAQKLALRKYLSLLLAESMEQQELLTSLLANIQNSKSKEIISSPSWQDLLSPFFKPKNTVLHDWMTEPYASNPNHPENLKFPSPSGHVLRSKSEVIIDMSLYEHRLPFRYESPLDLNGRIFYPDFTIRHPETGAFCYWEHFGMMDNPEYIDDCTSKLRAYARAGIIPTVNLITTYETADHPLSPQMVSRLIEEYFF